MSTQKQPRYVLLDISQIELLDNNPRHISNKEFKELCADIKRDPTFLQQRSPLINFITSENRFVCYAGQQRTKAAKHNGEIKIYCWVEDDVPAKLQDERMLKDNLHRGEWDIEKLFAFDTSFLLDVGFSLDFLADMQPKNKKEEAKASLSERFIVPPFSVLDTRQDYWMKRKKAWLSLGIVSFKSRESMEAQGSLSGSVPGYSKKKEKAEKAIGHTLTNDDFEANYLPDLIAEDTTLAYTESGAMLSIFDPVLCEICYSWFAPKGAEIFDPFAGGSVRGIVAAHLGHIYTGIDLRPEQVAENYANAKEVLGEKHYITWLAGDSLKTPVLTNGKKFDMIFSCPPYYDLEKYSKDKNDLSNQSWEDFAENYTEIIRLSVDQLKEDSFACFVVGEIRDRKTGNYRDFVSLTIAAFKKAGMNYYNEIILLTQAGSAPTRAGRQFRDFRKVAKVHQNVLVFYKGDSKGIKQKYSGLIDVKNLVPNE